MHGDLDSNYVVPELAGPPAGKVAPVKSMTSAMQWQRRYARPTVLPQGQEPRFIHARDGLRGLGWAPADEAANRRWRFVRTGFNVLSIYAGVQAVRGKKVPDAITVICLVGAVLDLVDAL